MVGNQRCGIDLWNLNRPASVWRVKRKAFWLGLNVSRGSISWKNWTGSMPGGISKPRSSSIVSLACARKWWSPSRRNLVRIVPSEVPCKSFWPFPLSIVVDEAGWEDEMVPRVAKVGWVEAEDVVDLVLGFVEGGWTGRGACTVVIGYMVTSLLLWYAAAAYCRF